MVNQKPVVVSNIPSDKILLQQAQHEESRSDFKRDAGYFLLARQHASKALALYIKAADISSQARLYQSLGDIDRQLENFASAQKWYAKAEHSYQKEKSFCPELLDARVGYALALRGESRYQETIQKLKPCLALYKRQKDLEGTSFVLWAMGTTYRFLGQLSKAEASLKSSLIIYRKKNDKSGYAYAQAGLGGTLRMRGLAGQSEKLYRQANQTFRELKDGFGIAYTYCGISNGMRMRNYFKEGLAISQKAEKLYRKLKQKGPLGFVLWSQAQALIYQKEFKSAFRCLKESEHIFSSVKDKRGNVYIHLGWGNYFSAQENHSQAKEHYKKAFSQAQKSDLGLEKVHAFRQLFNYQHPQEKFSWQEYKRLGVDVKHFGQYQTLP